MSAPVDPEGTGGDEMVRLRRGVAEIKRLRAEQGDLVRALMARGFTVRAIAQGSGVPRTTIHHWATTETQTE